MYADDVKAYRAVENDEDRQKVQRAAIDPMGEWADSWGLPLAAEKSCIFALGENQEKKYSL